MLGKSWVAHLQRMANCYYRPQRSWGKVMFLHVSVILFTGGGGWSPSMHCRWYPSMPYSRSLGPHLRGKLRGSGQPGGSPGLHQGGLQTHTQGAGGLQANTWGSPGPHLAGSPGPHPWGVCIPACTEADPPPQQLLLWVVRILLECIVG